MNEKLKEILHKNFDGKFKWLEASEVKEFYINSIGKNKGTEFVVMNCDDNEYSVSDLRLGSLLRIEFKGIPFILYTSMPVLGCENYFDDENFYLMHKSNSIYEALLQIISVAKI